MSTFTLILCLKIMLCKVYKMSFPLKNILETIAVLSTGHKKLIFQIGRFTTNKQKIARITPERWTDRQLWWRISLEENGKIIPDLARAKFIRSTSRSKIFVRGYKCKCARKKAGLRIQRIAIRIQLFINN